VFNFLKNLFGKKEVEVKPSPNLLTFSIVKTDVDSTLTENEHAVGLSIPNKEGFIDFLRNNSSLNIMTHTDQELAHLYLYQHCQTWLSENLKQPMFVETHAFQAHGEIKYERVWNTAFAESVAKIGFDTLPPSEEEMMEMYMNYIYGTRLMEEMELAEAATPQSIAHPQLTNPDNQFKG
jgi:hypothetical protein